MVNDHGYLAVPAKSADNRWIHRPAMDWASAEAHGNGPAGARVYSAIRRLVDARRSLPALHASVGTDAFVTENSAVLVFRRRHAAGTVVQVYNLSESEQAFDAAALWPLSGRVHEHISGTGLDVMPVMTVPPFGVLWLTSPM